MPNRPIQTRRRLLLAGAGAALSGCATPNYVPAPADAGALPTVRLGDRWRYAQIDLYRKDRTAELTMDVVAVAPQLRVRVTDAAGASRSDEIYASPWRVLQEPAYGEPLHFREPNPLLPTPLQAGAQERIGNRFRAERGELWLFWSEWIDALGWERVRVPAGEFVALRVRRRINFEHQDPFRATNYRDETLWYAPQVNRWVRREWTGRYRPAGGMREGWFNEEWVAWELLEYRAA